VSLEECSRGPAAIWNEVLFVPLEKVLVGSLADHQIQASRQVKFDLSPSFALNRDYIERQMDDETDGLPTRDSVIFGEIQVLLAEKRTALASLRTGIAVFALPLSVLSALIATSRFYSMAKVMPLLVPLMVLNLGLVVLGCWLVFRSIRRIHRFEHRIKELSQKYRSIAQFIE
jgi:uncharacterized membrane protein YidH (DUF202 family)